MYLGPPFVRIFEWVVLYLATYIGDNTRINNTVVRYSEDQVGYKYDRHIPILH